MFKKHNFNSSLQLKFDLIERGAPVRYIFKVWISSILTHELYVLQFSKDDFYEIV